MHSASAVCHDGKEVVPQERQSRSPQRGSQFIPSPSLVAWPIAVHQCIPTPRTAPSSHCDSPLHRRGLLPGSTGLPGRIPRATCLPGASAPRTPRPSIVTALRAHGCVGTALRSHGCVGTALRAHGSVCRVAARYRERLFRARASPVGFPYPGGREIVLRCGVRRPLGETMGAAAGAAEGSARPVHGDPC